MSAEACTLALKNTLNEIRNVCPEIQHAFVFREDGDVLAEDDNTPEVAVNNAQEAFRALSERANAVGGIESAAFCGAEAEVNITRFDDVYAATVCSREADEKTVGNLTRVMIPTTLKLIKNLMPAVKTQPAQTTDAVAKPATAVSAAAEVAEPEELKIEVQATEFTVENLTGFGGFLNDPETAYVDSALLVQWAETYGDKTITQVLLEAPTSGKSLQCKFRPFKDSKYENKGIVQLPDKIQSILRVQKGTQVLVKPVFMGEEKPIATSKEDLPEEAEQAAQAPKIDLFSNFSSDSRTAPVSQFMVENLRGFGGLLGNPDSVRVESAVVARWNEMFGDKEIKEVIVEETVFGKKIQCKFQAIRDSSLEGKGVIQLPEKVQQALRTKKGALVMVKPVIK